MAAISDRASGLALLAGSNQCRRRLTPMPELIVRRLSTVLRRVEKALVVLELEVRELQPHSRRVERVDMRRKTAVRVVEIVADILDVLELSGPEFRPLLHVSTRVSARPGGEC